MLKPKPLSGQQFVLAQQIDLELRRIFAGLVRQLVNEGLEHEGERIVSRRPQRTVGMPSGIKEAPIGQVRYSAGWIGDLSRPRCRCHDIASSGFEPGLRPNYRGDSLCCPFRRGPLKLGRVERRRLLPPYLFNIAIN